MNDTPRRYPTGIAIATVFLALAGYLGYLAVSREGWWLALLAPALFLAGTGLGGLGRDLPRKHRDDNGRPVSTKRGI